MKLLIACPEFINAISQEVGLRPSKFVSSSPKRSILSLHLAWTLEGRSSSQFKVPFCLDAGQRQADTPAISRFISHTANLQS